MLTWFLLSFIMLFGLQIGYDTATGKRLLTATGQLSRSCSVIACSNCSGSTTPSLVAVSVPASEFTNLGCSECTSINTTYVLDALSACAWQVTQPYCDPGTPGFVSFSVLSGPGLLSVNITIPQKCFTASDWHGMNVNYTKSVTLPVDCSIFNDSLSHASTTLDTCPIGGVSNACTIAATSVTVTS